MGSSDWLQAIRMGGQRNAFDRAKWLVDLARADLQESETVSCETVILADALEQACLALLKMPAPDIAALRHKLELFRDEELSALPVGVREEVLEALISDAQRLERQGRTQGPHARVGQRMAVKHDCTGASGAPGH